jgi:hypothetical protein
MLVAMTTTLALMTGAITQKDVNMKKSYATITMLAQETAAAPPQVANMTT